MTALFILTLLAQNEEPWFPSKPGTVLTFRKDNKDSKTTLEAVDASKLRIVRAGDKGFKDIPFDARSAVSLGKTEFQSTIAAMSEKEIRIFHNYFGEDLCLQLSIPLDVKDGSQWTFRQVVMSCGYMGLDMEAKATSERITVPAGTFDALRIDVSHGKSSETSYWIVRGMGIVKSGEGELVKIELPK